MSEKCDVAVVGAGLVGLATAHALLEARPELSVVVLEQGVRVAPHQSSHNSGVIHSGIYYKPGSYKSKLCLDGAARMTAFCDRHGVSYRKCGKVIVATRATEVGRLENLYERGQAAGVSGLGWLNAAEVVEYEPNVRGICAVLVPGTAVVDFGTVAERLAEVVQGQGGRLWLGAGLHGAGRDSNWVLETGQGELRARAVINCGGLWSDRVARLLGARPSVRIIPFRGAYLQVRPERASLVRALVYPVPDPDLPFLGVHLSRELDGRVLAGPSAVLALSRAGYRALDISIRDVLAMLRDPAFWRMGLRYWRAALLELRSALDRRAFMAQAQAMVPEIQPDDFMSGTSGVRAQAVDDQGCLVDDFVFVEQPNALHVLNAPSPAATASLAIGRHIAERAVTLFDRLR